MAAGAPDYFRPANTAYETDVQTHNADANPIITPTIKVRFLLLFSDQEITVRFNSATNDPWTIKANRPYKWEDFNITSIHVTNTAQTDLQLWMEGTS